MAKAPTSRNGTVLVKNDKQINNLSIRTDDLIIKTSRASETVSISDFVDLDTAGVIYYPTSEATIFDPAVGTAYPMGAY